MTTYTLLDIAGGLLGPPLAAALLSIPQSLRCRTWFAGWWLGAAGWTGLGCALAADAPGCLSAAVSFAAGSVVWWMPVRKRA